jgi:hypothetical protein
VPIKVPVELLVLFCGDDGGSAAATRLKLSANASTTINENTHLFATRDELTLKPSTGALASKVDLKSHFGTRCKPRKI